MTTHLPPGATGKTVWAFNLRAAILGDTYAWKQAIKEMPGKAWWDAANKCWMVECTTFDKLVVAAFEERLLQLERVGLTVKRLHISNEGL